MWLCIPCESEPHADDAGARASAACGEHVKQEGFGIYMVGQAVGGQAVGIYPIDDTVVPAMPVNVFGQPGEHTVAGSNNGIDSKLCVFSICSRFDAG